jgi:hypothetical protein
MASRRSVHSQVVQSPNVVDHPESLLNRVLPILWDARRLIRYLRLKAGRAAYSLACRGRRALMPRTAWPSRLQ